MKEAQNQETAGLGGLLAHAGVLANLEQLILRLQIRGSGTGPQRQLGSVLIGESADDCI